MRLFLLIALSALALSAADLFTAVQNHDLAAVRQLIKGGSDVNTADKSGSTPLMHCAVYSTAECMKILLDAGAKIDHVNEAGATALHWAISDFDKVQLLVSRGAN